MARGSDTLRVTRMSSDQDSISDALTQIRSNALLLSVANAYLCEPPLLKRIGQEMVAGLGALEGQISRLKGQFPGKFVKEVETDRLVKEVRRKAEELQSPDKSVLDKCAIGDLGKELEEGIAALTEGVRSLQGQVEGKLAPYTAREAVSAALEKGGAIFPGFSPVVIRGFFLLMACLAIVFVYLFFTMHTDEDLVREIQAAEAQLQADQKIYAEIEAEKKRILGKMEVFKGKVLDREEKIIYLDLGDQLRTVEEKQSRLDDQIMVYEKKIREQQTERKALRDKPFIQRLLRM